MTIKKLIEKYVNLQKMNYETIIISQVISDLRQIQMKYNLIKYKRRNK
jgi:hypothetical protein